MKIIWSSAAVRQLQEAVEYIQPESTGGAITTRRRILETALRVGQIPYSGRVGHIDGTREAVVPRSPYILVYQLSSQSVEILGIWHAARQWPDSF